jgi:glycosyltransferase involved in cell wall biosynthesis
MKITILSHNLSSNAAMRAHRLALAAQTFAEVKLLGPVERRGLWPALGNASWIHTVPEERFPKFFSSFQQLLEKADGDVLLAAKPHLASFGAALVAGEFRSIPVILDHDDLDVGFVPRSSWSQDPNLADPSRPASAVYLSLLTRATALAAAVTVSSSALQQRFGGTVIPHGAQTDLFDPAKVDGVAAKQALGLNGAIVLFAGTARQHKGILPLAEAVRSIKGAQLVVTCRPKDLNEPLWSDYPLVRIPFVPYEQLPNLLAAADLIAIPQLDIEASWYQMPMKVYDAMAMAKPIVASTVSDLHLVLDGCARLVPPGNSDALRAAIAELLHDPAAARGLGESARARCLESFSLPRVGELLKNVVAAVLAASKTSRGRSLP